MVSDNIQMIKRITFSQIVAVFLLLSSAVDAQSSSPPVVAPPNPTLPNRIPSLDPTVLAFVCVLLFVGGCSIYFRRSATTANFHSSTGPQGIDPKLLETFPILPCSAVKQLKFGSAAPECAVCLTEFDHDDKLRLLPKCNHVFHSECIDVWLASHVTCPVCRTRLKPAEERHRGGNEVVIVIPNEVIYAHHMFEESSVSGMEVINSGRDRRSLGRCHSTGHSVGLGEIGMKETERYNLRSEDVRKQITVDHGGMRRSVSYDAFR